MQDKKIFDLLTKEYTLKLVITKQDIEFLKEVRTKVLLPAYEKHTHIEDIDKFLYNQDDKQSFIYILIHNETQKPVGTIRMFFINDKSPIKQLPMQMYGGVDDIDEYTKHKPICEISRLALIKDLPKHQTLSALSLRTSLTMGLFVALGINIFLYPYQYIFSIMEPALFRIIRKHGVLFDPIGKSVDYFGPRIPHAIQRDTLIYKSKPIIGYITLYYLKNLALNPNEFIEYINNHPYIDKDDILINKLIEIINNNPDITVDGLLETTS